MSMEANTELEELTALFEEDGLDTENEIDNHEDSNIFSSKGRKKICDFCF